MRLSRFQVFLAVAVLMGASMPAHARRLRLRLPAKPHPTIQTPTPQSAAHMNTSSVVPAVTRATAVASRRALADSERVEQERQVAAAFSELKIWHLKLVSMRVGLDVGDPTAVKDFNGEVARYSERLQLVRLHSQRLKQAMAASRNLAAE